MPKLKLDITGEVLRLAHPFRIAGHVFESWETITVTLDDGLHAGRGQASGVFFLGEDNGKMLASIEAVRSQIESDPDREELRSILPPCSARNAIDSALWDLEAARSTIPVWQLAGVPEPRPIVTTFTLGADTPERMAIAAIALHEAQALKIKLTGDVELDLRRVRAIRDVRDDAWLGVDGNQGFLAGDLDELISGLDERRVSLLEQPLARGQEAMLEGLDSPIPIAGDESILSLEDVRMAPGRFQVVNIKLDKCGGLTEGLLMAAEARRLGLGVMVGTMICTSPGTAPAFVLGQVADFIDLDGPTSLTHDCSPAAIYRDGKIFVGSDVWGS